MSVDYFVEIYSSSTIRILANFIGMKDDDTVDPDELRLKIYAYDSKTRKEFFSETLSLGEIRTLYQHLNQISVIRDTDSSSNETKFIEASKDIIKIIQGMEKCDTEFLEEVFRKFSSDEKREGILKYLSGEELQELKTSIIINKFEESLSHLKELLDMERKKDIVKSIYQKKNDHLSEYRARQPEKIFQKWIEANLWILGIEYIRKLEKSRIGLSSDSDLIMLNPEGFVDLIELKRPKVTLFKYDGSHKSYFPTSELSKALGQCLLYFKTLDTNKPIIESEYGVKVLAPRIKLIIGRHDEFNQDQLDALRVLNSNLNHIQILTYDNLLNNGEMIIKYYNNHDNDE